LGGEEKLEELNLFKVGAELFFVKYFVNITISLQCKNIFLSLFSVKMKTNCLIKLSAILACLFILSEFNTAQNNLITASDNISPGFPIIKNYLPKEYKAHNQNWAIVKDKRGIMYFGNSSGVLEFDGQSWNLIKVTNGIVRSMCIDNNQTVFVGSADDLGYLVRDKNNATLYYKTLTQYLPVKESIGHVWYTFYIDKSVFFITKNFIFQFTFSNSDYTDPDIKYWKTKSRYKIAHKVNNKLFVLDTDDDLLCFNGQDFSKIHGSEIFRNNTIYSMLPYDDASKKILIATKKSDFFLYDGSDFLPFKTESSKFLLENNIYLPGVKLPDNSFVYNTSKNGIVFINSAGSIIRKINMETGIPDDGVIFTFYSDNKLWLALQNGISEIDLPSPITYFNQTAGLKGSISDVKIFGNRLYAASTAGIYALNLNNEALS
jgi:hypothetical protein